MNVQAQLEDLAESINRVFETLKESEIDRSAFKFYSIGVVAENKARSTTDLLVTPVEYATQMYGELIVEPQVMKNKGVDSFDREYEVEIETTNAIPCRWLPWDSNRVTAPDMRRGERVVIMRFADADEYFWVDLGLDADLRRLETVAFLLSADPNGVSNDPRGPENSYLFEASTHDKRITIHTTKLNEEPFAYTVQINTEDGYITITDDANNYIYLNSAEELIKFHNRQSTTIELNRKNINMFAPDSINIQATKSINIECTDYTLKASQSITQETTTYSVSATSYKVDAPNAEFTGNLKVGGQSEFMGPMKANGIDSPSAPIKGPSDSI